MVRAPADALDASPPPAVSVRAADVPAVGYDPERSRCSGRSTIAAVESLRARSPATIRPRGTPCSRRGVTREHLEQIVAAADRPHPRQRRDGDVAARTASADLVARWSPAAPLFGTPAGTRSSDEALADMAEDVIGVATSTTSSTLPRRSSPTRTTSSPCARSSPSSGGRAPPSCSWSSAADPYATRTRRAALAAVVRDALARATHGAGLPAAIRPGAGRRCRRRLDDVRRNPAGAISFLFDDVDYGDGLPRRRDGAVVEHELAAAGERPGPGALLWPCVTWADPGSIVDVERRWRRRHWQLGAAPRQ